MLNCCCSLHYNCSLRLVTEYIFFRYLLLFTLCFMSTFHGSLCKNIGFWFGSAGIPVTSLTSCLLSLSFVFADQIYLIETNAAKWFVLIMHWKLQPQLMFSPTLEEKDYCKPWMFLSFLELEWSWGLLRYLRKAYRNVSRLFQNKKTSCFFSSFQRNVCHGGILLRYKRAGMTCYLVDLKWIPLSVTLASIMQDCFFRCLFIVIFFFFFSPDSCLTELKDGDFSSHPHSGGQLMLWTHFVTP